MGIKVSVVVPVYNAEMYLRECLDSLINQTLKDMEVICVDDGSTDESIGILNEYAEADSRIKVIEQQNQFAGVARNRGLSAATGEYILFLDADDFFDTTMLEKVYIKGSEYQADIVMFGAKRYDTSSGVSIEASYYFKRDLLPEAKVFSRKDISDAIFNISSPAPWTKAFKREFIIKEHLLFQPLHNSNDVFFVLTALAVAERITTVDADLVYYRVGQKNNLQSKKSDYPLCFLEAYTAVYDELKGRGIYEEVEKSFTDIVLSGCVYNLESAATETVRCDILRAFQSEKFTEMGLLDHEKEYYAYPMNAVKIRGTKYALAQWDSYDKVLKEKNVQIKADRRMDGIPKVSVIIPVYEVEKYLRECLESIINQTLQNIEIICVNDGSMDNSMDILLEYAEKDNRFIILSQKNEGLSSARNRGIEKVSGKYIYFMDSDDILNLNALELLYDRAEKDKLDVVYFDGVSFFEDEETENNNSIYAQYYIRKNNYSKVYTGVELLGDMLGNNEYRTSPCLQMISRDYLTKIDLLFYEGILHEDHIFNFKCMIQARRVSHLAEALFHRRVRAGSIMTSNATFRHVYGYFVSFLEMFKFMENSEYCEASEEDIAEIMSRVLKNARRIYAELSEEERYGYLGMHVFEKRMFQLFVVDGDHSIEKELRETLQRTYDEKSEINRKLQITYREKAERGIRIKDLNKRIVELKSNHKEEVQKLKKKILDIQNSTSYRIGRIITKPLRIIKNILKR